MFKELPRHDDQTHKLSRRQLGRLIVGSLATAALGPIAAACGPSAEQQMDASINAFATAKPDISTWEPYKTTNELSLKLKHPQEWEAGGLSVGDGGLDSSFQRKAMALEPKSSYLPRIVILSERVPAGMTEESLFQGQVNGARRDKDLTEVKVTDIKLPQAEAKMLSYIGTYSVLVHSERLATHTVTLIRNGRAYNFTFRGKPEEIAKDMSVFKGILQSVEFLKQ